MIVKVGAGKVEGWLKSGQAGNPFVLHHDTACLFFLHFPPLFLHYVDAIRMQRARLEQRTSGMISPTVYMLSVEQNLLSASFLARSPGR